MKGKVAILIVIILCVLFYLAWRRETIQVEVEKPDFMTPKAKPEKAKKSKAPNSREEKCRDIFESLTGRPYPTIRPSWLRNPKTNRRLELDGFNADLRSAFEYNGKQHRVYPNSFHKSEEEFQAQLERDEIKYRTCEEYGTRLLVIPDTVRDDELHDLIKNHLVDIGVLT